MSALILRIYDYFTHHRRVCALSCLALTLLLALSAMRLSYKEDISDFLPLGGKEISALKAWQNYSGANRVFAIFKVNEDAVEHTNNASNSNAVNASKANNNDAAQSLSDEERCNMIADAIDSYVAALEEADTAQCLTNIMWQVDMERMGAMAEDIYRHAPYFLTDNDYRRMDSLLAEPDYIASQLRNDKQLLLLPSASLMAGTIASDPLNLFSPMLQRLQRGGDQLRYETFSGYIFSPDMQRAIVMMTSPYGSSESEKNTQLLAMLESVAKSTMGDCPGVTVEYLGAPIIAVGNARQIKSDSVLSVTIAVVLILALLLAVFRNVRSIVLIAVAIAWGALFALGGLALVHDNVSVIVIGISSVIIGIAVNYPLHEIAHMPHATNRRTAMQEIVTPLIVGNVTTVGAFLALVPLQSVALRDLGVFAALLLVGTIVFVVIYLPHMVKVKHSAPPRFLETISDLRLENRRWFVAVLAILTAVFACFSTGTQFDANMAHINYMTDAERQNMAYFNSLFTADSEHTQLFVLAEGSNDNEALERCGERRAAWDSLMAEGLLESYGTCSHFLVGESEQAQRIERWNAFVERHGSDIIDGLRQGAAAEGFGEAAFSSFLSVLQPVNTPLPLSQLQAATGNMLNNHLYVDSESGTHYAIDQLSVPTERLDDVKERLARSGIDAFDLAAMNSSVANHLSNNFNYIGWACGLIVFFFLWLSMGSLELAIISFVPMAVSWVWILGIMTLLGVQFNIVNIILATFIFGQGDDYTIFMTEGAVFEYANRRKILSSYKSSIVVSALIMFIGIGSLIIARHPALHSLAELTIIGMFAVVLMAYTLPPYLFRILVANSNGYRPRPLRLSRMLVCLWGVIVFFSQIVTVYVYGFILLELLPATPRRRYLLRRYVHRCYLYDMTHIPNVRFCPEGFAEGWHEHPAIIVCNHQSMLDSALFFALTPHCVLVSNGRVSSNRIIAQIYRWTGSISLTDDLDLCREQIRQALATGTSVVIFPEGQRNAEQSILRFHKGAFLMADELGADLLPVVLHGVNQVLPRNSWSLYEGVMTLRAAKRLTPNEQRRMGNVAERTKAMRRWFADEFDRLSAERATISYFAPLVIDRYRYKGVEIVLAVKRTLAKAATVSDKQAASTQTGLTDTSLATTAGIRLMSSPADIHLHDNSYGEMALALALMHPKATVYVEMIDSDRANILRYSAEGVASNIVITAPSTDSATQ